MKKYKKFGLVIWEQTIVSFDSRIIFWIWVIYEVAHLSTVEWECTNCSVPNFSSTIFDLSSLEHSNNFSAISKVGSVSSLGSPQAASSPVHNPSNPAKAPSIPTQTVTCQAPRNSKLGNALHVVNINFQSVMAKKAELHQLIDSTKPDIIIGIETWLHEGIKTQEFLPDNFDYSIYRSDQKTSSDHPGGVLIAVTKRLVSNSVPELEKNYEILWAKINLVSVNTSLVGAFYWPHMKDRQAIKELQLSLQSLNRSNATIWLVGDFNAPYIDWSIPGVIKGTCYSTAHEELLGVAQDHGLEQVVLKPTRGNNILDLFFTNHPAKVNRVEIMSQISDHNTVFWKSTSRLKPSSKSPRRYTFTIKVIGFSLRPNA